jgi:hypothetical protein
VPNWHVVLLDDVDSLDHREEHIWEEHIWEEHLQEDPASRHVATDGSEASSMTKHPAASNRICHL